MAARLVPTLRLRGGGPAASKSITVAKFQYFMNGHETGTLSLLSEPQRCSWKSTKTGLQTGWHGEWAHTSQGYCCRFDCMGKDNTKKWSHLIPHGAGRDYRRREIRVAHREVWVLDEHTRTFLLGSKM